ncbi:OsmC family protein [Truepera radiovictrix]|uniref:Peroxiredoxin, OsmC subfamily n=1 Tax=Truepera radiovictrix (strain DSM 17093 / CIP 108686 / LMG 22925 / RQ-24) TaxID=649638 RepID=D7CTV0_TRURR|nr:OsmC family protein [Truepera radiovictrix]ADI15647.1 peroxiredoxin, OsmC subfamily [Truepera radiovictrix DSM 17093]WMT58724.1 OsmC family protein [Truepera radiovictrix]
MALVRSANAVWQGDLKGGQGTLTLPKGGYEGRYSYTSRFEEGTGTNPEELIAAAHAGCFSMALANMLAEAGHTPESIATTAKVEMQGLKITKITLHTEGRVPGLDEARFLEHAENAKQHCPVSQALAAVEIQLEAKLA